MNDGYIKRYLTQSVREDMKEKMIFIGGARQVGKTTFAQSLFPHYRQNHPAYLNWDNPKIRTAVLRGEIPSHQPLIIFDEIHKYARWRSLVKGFYDTYKSSVSFVITGSARLDYYRRGGDSLCIA